MAENKVNQETKEPTTSLIEDVQTLQQKSEPSGFFKFLSFVNAVEQLGQGNFQPFQQMKMQQQTQKEALEIAKQTEFVRGPARRKMSKLLNSGKLVDALALGETEKTKAELIPHIEATLPQLRSPQWRAIAESQLKAGNTESALRTINSQLNRQQSTARRDLTRMKTQAKFTPKEEAVYNFQQAMNRRGFDLASISTIKKFTETYPEIPKGQHGLLFTQLKKAQRDGLPVNTALNRIVGGGQAMGQMLLKSKTQPIIEQALQTIASGQPLAEEVTPEWLDKQLENESKFNIVEPIQQGKTEVSPSEPTQDPRVQAMETKLGRKLNAAEIKRLQGN